MSISSYAFYRLPYSDTYTLVESEHEPLQLAGIEEVGLMPGFVLYPFGSENDTPALLIRPDSMTVRTLLPVPEEAACMAPAADENPDEGYSAAFETFHGAVAGGVFRKLVLARRRTVSLSVPVDTGCPSSVRPLFERACRMYPRLMVMLFSTPVSGTWLVASPEILLDGKGRSLHTVALAGTMPFREGHLDWSDKNKMEQHIVEQYMEGRLAEAGTAVIKDGPVTMRAGNLVHLRTDFRFHLAPDVSLGTLIGRLHPTPAVCGMPKEEAAAFIRKNEGIDRRYYSGFAGPVGIHDETHLYVSLRCAQIVAPDTAVLYAGGGIMPGSDCRSEWMETESKMNTIRNVLQ